jgi:ELWxxDGT repeat protein
MNTKRIFLIFIFSLLVFNIVGQQLLKDIGQGSVSGSPSFLTDINGTLFFAADDGINGRELWKSDGTSAGTILLKDVSSGINESFLNSFINVNGTLFFVADDGINGKELWKSDGTSAGTILVKDVAAGPIGSDPIGLINVNGTLYFNADDGINGSELWKSDGTSSGTILVKDIISGPLGPFPESLTNLNGTLFFVANDGSNGVELWKSDGTSLGTIIVKDISPGINNSYPSALTNINGILYFRADNGSNGVELWKSDGTSVGTVLVKDISVGVNNSFPNEFTYSNGTIFFHADNGVNGDELWKTDGTASGTVLVKDIWQGNNGSYITYLTNLNGVLYFNATDGINDMELWKSDGTAAGTVLVQDIGPGPIPGTFEITNVNATLYIMGDNGVDGQELWTSDGTTAGTIMVKDINPGPGGSQPVGFTLSNGKVFFAADDGISGYELWSMAACSTPNQPTAIAGNTNVSAGSTVIYSVSAVPTATSYIWTLPAGYTGSSSSNSISVTIGSSNGIISVVAQNSCGASSASSILLSVPSSTVSAQVSLCQPYLFKNIKSQNFCNINGIMLIGVQNDGLWKSDGTAAGTVKINAAPQYITGPLAIHGNIAYFKSAKQIWKTDGTEAGTIMVMDIPNATSLGSLVPAGNYVFFLVSINNSVINKLWKTDGTAAGTSLVKDIDPTNSISWDPRFLFAYNNNLYFKAGNSTYGMELWKSDGTIAGTVVVRDVNPGPGDGTSSLGSYFAIYNNELYYFGGYTSSGTFSYGLWKTNGTDPGTLLVQATSYITNLTVINSLLYFFAYDVGGVTGNSIYGEELWRSDGTAPGTYMVKDIKPGSGSGISSGSQLENINGKIIFGASDGSTGIELWASDGTANGTQLLKDIYTGSQSSLGNYFISSDAINGYIYFSANDGNNGHELWVTDGTVSGTFLVLDIWPGISGSGPHFFHVFNGNLYFAAEQSSFDAELWSCGNFVGVQTLYDDNKIQIYPNPSSGIVKIKNTISLQNAKIKVFNIHSQIIFESNQFIDEIDLSNQPKGVYFIQINAENKVSNKKVIMQ